jgi:predicted ATPase/DNA-binding SARP family transcriptional activator
MTLYIHLFGHLRLFVDGQPHKFNALPKTYPLLAYLLLHRHTPVPRDALAFLLWDDVPESEARANLRRHLHDLRRALPPDSKETPWILNINKTLQWNANAPYWLDVAAFEQTSQTTERLAEAVTHYTGNLLADLYDDWLAPFRDQLQAQYLTALTRLMQRQRERGDIDQAIVYARQLLQYDPAREDVVRILIRLHVEQGDRASAIQAYRRFEERLFEELGVEPMAETAAYHHALTQNQPLPDDETAPPSHSPTAAAGQSPSPSTPHNLPAPITRFVGREAELAAIFQILGSVESHTRLVTITGPGGSGKTRLALEAANFLRQNTPELFPDGLFFVRLDDLRQAEQLITAVTDTLSFQPDKNHNPANNLLNYLRHKKLLLLLDNFEHLLPAATLVSQWLAAAAGLRVLVTSQMLLHLYGEQELSLPPLPLPTATVSYSTAELSAYPAIALFVDRARATRPDFGLDDSNAAAIADICISLDGMPLALELAAARSKFFNPNAMRDQLKDRLRFLSGQARDLSTRQRTLRATIDWSYQLLDENERILFNALSVFIGPFTLAAAEAVATVAIPPDTSIFDLLEALVDRNMVRQLPSEEVPRFRLLQTLREYGLEKLEQMATAVAIRDQHAFYYRQLAEAAEQGLRTPQQAAWLQNLLQEESNMKAAQEWLFSDPTHIERCIEGAKLITANERFWTLRGRLNEARAAMEKAVAYHPHMPIPMQIHVLNRAGSIAQWQGDYDQASEWHHIALNLARQIQDDKLLGYTLHFLGTIAGRQGDYESARALLSESLEYYRRESSFTSSQLNPLLNNLAIVHKRLGDLETAEKLLDEAISLRRATNDLLGLAANLNNLANIVLSRGNRQRARALFSESLSLSQQTQDHPSLVYSIGHAADLCAAEGQSELAVRFYAALAVQRRQLNLPPTADVQADHDRYLAEIRIQLSEAAFNRIWTAGEKLSLDEVIQEVRQVLDPDSV